MGAGRPSAAGTRTAKTARFYMAELAPVPTVAEVRRHSFGRAKVVEALQDRFGVQVHPRTGARALKAQLVQLIERQAPGSNDAAGGQCAAQQAPRTRDDGQSAAVRALVDRMGRSGGAFRPEDMTFSVRSMLDDHAHTLPGTLASLQPIANALAEVNRALSCGQQLPDKMHRAIKACLVE